MIALTPEEAGRALGLAPLSATVTGVSVDSRTIEPGDLFVALRGERFDGHDFVEAALTAGGASGAVVEKPAWALRGGSARCRRQGVGPVYEVEDSLEALWSLARAARRKSEATVLAITGSVGKTSTKDLLGAMVGKVRRVVITRANQNNEVGVPLTLLAIRPDTEAVIVEMGMRGTGQIAALARVTEPDVGLITNIHPVHLELLGTLEGIAQAKAELLFGLKPGGTAVIPIECASLRPHASAAACRMVYFGVGRDGTAADVQGRIEPHEGAGGYLLTVRWPQGEAEIETPFIPRHSLENVIAAAAACYAAALPVAECLAGVREVQVTSGRGEVVRLPGLRLINDTYNASPAAVGAAVDELVRVAAELGARPVAVLGDMLELGPHEDRFHREAGERAAQAGVRVLWGVGPLSRSMVDGFDSAWRELAGKGGEWTAGHVGSAEETCSVMDGLRPGDVVLFKASRSMRLETMVAKVIDEAEAGRWSSESSPSRTEPDEPRERRR